MSDHAEIIRAALKQATAEHLRHHHLLPEWAAIAESALDGLLADHADGIERLRALADDSVSGLRYIEQRYGRLDGVGWDRVYALAAEEEPQEGYRERPITEDFYEHNGEWVYRWNDERWVLRATAQEPPAAPCYVCGHPVAEGEGWRRDSKTWCPDHRPVWSHD